jgi:hypothetical protein
MSELDAAKLCLLQEIRTQTPEEAKKMRLLEMGPDIGPNVKDHLLQKAIRILEAAGNVEVRIDEKAKSVGVEPNTLLRMFDCAWSGDNYESTCDHSGSCSVHQECRKAKRQIRAVLAAIPDGGPK